MVDAFVALGSNVGDRRGNLRKALDALGERNSILKVSSFYETEPMYIEAQPWFLNCVAKIRTELTPESLFGLVKSIERKMGRNPVNGQQRYGPRVIDIDILFYGDLMIYTNELEIPHPRIQERLFVLVPLVEIEPELVHPKLNRSVSHLLKELHSEKRIMKLKNP